MHSPSFFFQPLSAFGSGPNLPAQETRTTRRSDTDKPGPAHLTPSPIKPIHPSSFASHITTFKISWLLTECLFCKWPCHWILCHTMSSYMFVTCHLLLMFDQQLTQKTEFDSAANKEEALKWHLPSGKQRPEYESHRSIRSAVRKSHRSCPYGCTSILCFDRTSIVTPPRIIRISRTSIKLSSLSSLLPQIGRPAEKEPQRKHFKIA